MVDNPTTANEGRILIKATLLSTLLLAGCTQDSGGPVSTRQVTAVNVNVGDGKHQGLGMHKFDLNRHPMTKTVCDPFNNGQTTDPTMGVKASLFYRGQGQPRWYTAKNYIEHGKASSQSLFFADLFVPTRMFSEGFATQSSETVKDDSGQKLIEYFALKFETNLVLGPDDPEGDYELSILSDDGTVVRVNVDGTWHTLITNEGDHPTRMGCTNRLIPMVRGAPRPLEISYYQGPKYHISHVLMWRPSHDALVGKDAECGKEGNEYFFDPGNGSAPLAAYNRLLGRDWKPVKPENYMIAAGGESYNPCTNGGTAPVISNFQVEEVLAYDVFVSWETDIPATSQVLYKIKGSSNQQITDSDNQLRTRHRLQLSGLDDGATYILQAVSTGEDLGKGMGPETEVTTFELSH